MTRTLTTFTAAGALVAATLVTTTPARAMDPWTAAAWFAGGAIVAGLFWAPWAYGATRPYGYAAYGYAPGYSAYGYAPGYAPVGYAATARSCYPAQIWQGGIPRTVRVCY
jgi:hypothetical protein